MEASNEPRVAQVGFGYWGPNLARTCTRLGKTLGYLVEPDAARRVEVAPGTRRSGPGRR